MRVLVCIDDTDNLESRGTGKLAAILAGQIDQDGWGQSAFITRHQLFVHPDIPYTSHNSSMCFAAEVPESGYGLLVDHAGDFLARESADGSDPGLCVVVLTRLADAERLCAFGRAAKSQVLTKQAAYALAHDLGIHLSEHGGTGQGVIGALAGAGLRLGGNDGRMRGRLEIDAAGASRTVAALLAHPLIDRVQTLEGEPLGAEERVELGGKVKTVLLDGKAVLLVVPQTLEGAAARWQTCPHEIIKTY
ncbi:MAG: hypothetical protein HY899_10190 [Deltaproteobacteria bacterium]|nr:hypothetical protein [Deltaproteobacteria bacterium]